MKCSLTLKIALHPVNILPCQLWIIKPPQLPGSIRMCLWIIVLCRLSIWQTILISSRKLSRLCKHKKRRKLLIINQLHHLEHPADIWAELWRILNSLTPMMSTESWGAENLEMINMLKRQKLLEIITIIYLILGEIRDWPITKRIACP